MTPAHEIMHALGRDHEHQRPDRDKYVTIDPKNSCQFHNITHNYNGIFYTYIGPYDMTKFDNLKTHNIEYDYGSVMHYSRWQCSYKHKEKEKPSMSFTRKFKGNKDDVGQRTKLTARDIQHINAEYCASELIIINCAVIHIY